MSVIGWNEMLRVKRWNRRLRARRWSRPGGGVKKKVEGEGEGIDPQLEPSTAAGRDH